MIGAIGAMSVGLLGEISVGGCSELSGIANDNSSSISIVMLGWETRSLGYSVTECGDQIGVEDHCGMILGQFTCKSTDLQADSAWESESKIGSLGRETHSSSRPPCRPSRYTTSTPHCKSL